MLRTQDLSRAAAMLARSLSAVLVVSVGVQSAAGQDKKPLEPWVAPMRASKKANPEHADANSLSVGKRIFERECLACHGAKGLGDGPKAADLERRPGNLADPALWDESDGALFWKLTEGRAPMPATKTLLSDDERWHVINYVRTLAPTEAAPSIPKFVLEDAPRKALSQVIRAYETLRTGLVDKGDGAAAAAAVPALADAAAALAAVDAASIAEAARSAWLDDAKALSAAAEALKSAGADVPKLRAALGACSAALIAALERYGHNEAGAVFVFVAVPTGGQPLSWIQTEPKPRDPYGAGGDTEKQQPKQRLGGKKR
jgi:mono/diheme cytochrome c family protein